MGGAHRLRTPAANLRLHQPRSVDGQNQAVPFATTATGRAQLDRAVHILGTYRREAKRVWWGNPENALGRLAKLNLKDDGIDARPALLSVMPWCKPSRTNGLPFSMSQNLIVPSYQLKPKMVGLLGTFDLKSWFSWVSRDLELAMGFYLNARSGGISEGGADRRGIP